MLSENSIRTMANDTSYARGCKYQRDGRVSTLSPDPSAPHTYRAEVRGRTDDYKVTVRLNNAETDVLEYHCNCPAAKAYLGMCKHVVAVLKEHQATQEDDVAEELTFQKLPQSMDSFLLHSPTPKRESRSSGARLLESFSSALQRTPPKIAQKVHLVPRLFVDDPAEAHPTCWLEFRMGEDTLYVVKSLKELIDAMRIGKDIRFGKSFTLRGREACFADELSEKLFSMLRRTKEYEDALSMENRYYYTRTPSFFDQKRLYLTPNSLLEFLSILGDTPVEFRTFAGEPYDVRVMHAAPPLRFQVDSRNGAARMELLGDLQSLDDDGRFFVAEDKLYVVENDEDARVLRPIADAFRRSCHVDFPRTLVPNLFTKLLPDLTRIADVTIASAFFKTYEITPLRAEFYLDYYKDGVEVLPKFCYGELFFNPLNDIPTTADGRTLVRDTRAENDLLNFFDAYDFERKGDKFVQADEDKSYDFLVDALPALAEKADVFYADAFQKRPVQNIKNIRAGVSVNDESLLEVSFQSDEMDMDELMDVLSSYRQKRRYHRLKDGTFVTLETQQLDALSDFAIATGMKKGQVKDGEVVTMPLSNAMYLDALAREETSLQLERSKKFKALVRDIRNPQDAMLDVPSGVATVLRDYQITGFNWLSTLSAYGLGGILADDMGLGKTLQVISFLLAKQDESEPPSIVVAPTSLIYNWADEIAKFAPALHYAIIAGTKAERTEKLGALPADTDVVLTTYNMLKRDIDAYEKAQFRYAFLDEAQHIKNPATQNAKAVKRIPAKGFFALTGTPIENTLTELWSIFDFLMPGYLMTHNKFRTRYEEPIVKDGSENAMKDLKRHILPFILRRMKKDVLKELPDKVERQMKNEMTTKQEKVYQAYFLQSRKDVAAALKEQGMGGRMKILTIVTRLRQIACDPALFLENYDGGSGKLDMLEEIVQEATDAGHRILIFSQFTSMLARIGERLKKMSLDYFYLDGAVPAATRLRLVKAFNAGECPVFLISLKAGGTGLNLTGADMVIHYDPWWNPAVEEQATDRAYRLGQQKNVQVLRMITKDTIEEKIFHLQEKKRSLIDAMIEPGENFLSKLSEEEIAELFQTR